MLINKKESGFTLIELLIVIGIIAILAAAIIVAVSPGDQLEAAREATVKAQMQAIATAMYYCEVEGESDCGPDSGPEAIGHGDFGDVDLPDVNHPVTTCGYEAEWDGTRVKVDETGTGCTGVGPITY